MGVIGRTVEERVRGEQPSRMRSFATAAVAGVALGVVVYKLLRSGGDQADE
jgi:hypothetical protein